MRTPGDVIFNIVMRCCMFLYLTKSSWEQSKKDLYIILKKINNENKR